MAIFWSAPERDYSRDVEYQYRQDSDLLYLTGIDAARHHPRADARQPDKQGDPVRPAAGREARALERAQPDPEEATALTGIATVHETPAFDGS